jgi:hypothetical protein
MILSSISVSFQLPDPEIPAVCRHRAIFATTMSMPEAAVDENDGFVFGQNNIGRNRSGTLGLTAKG